MSDQQEVEQLLAISEADNFYAATAYAPAWEAIARNPSELAALDLFACNLGHSVVPALRNGSNAYLERCVRPHRLCKAHEQFERSPDCYVVVPETGYFSESGRASLPGDTRTAIRSVQGGAPKRYLWWPTGESRALQSLCVRHYDSHLSVYAYFMLARAVLIRLLGSLGAPFSIELEPRRYVGDLAQRFSDRRIVGHFISEKYLVNEMLMPSGNRGIVKSYSNVDAPVRKRLLLLGDSHSYSAMAPACSYYFSEVSFIWANKVDSYSPREALVEELWAAADFVVEESAERFFIANLCEAVN